MTDLTAWVPIWEREPALVPAAWHKIDMNGGEEGEPLHIVWARCTGRGETYTYKPESPEPIDLAAQLGTAVQWLASRDAYAVATIEAGPDIAATLELLRVRVEARLSLDCAAGESK